MYLTLKILFISLFYFIFSGKQDKMVLWTHKYLIVRQICDIILRINTSGHCCDGQTLHPFSAEFSVIFIAGFFFFFYMHRTFLVPFVFIINCIVKINQSIYFSSDFSLIIIFFFYIWFRDSINKKIIIIVI